MVQFIKLTAFGIPRRLAQIRKTSGGVPSSNINFQNPRMMEHLAILRAIFPVTDVGDEHLC